MDILNHVYVLTVDYIHFPSETTGDKVENDSVDPEFE